MTLAQLVCIFFIVFSDVNARMLAETSPTIDVRNYGVHADGVSDDSRVPFTSYFFHFIKILGR